MPWRSERAKTDATLTGVYGARELGLRGRTVCARGVGRSRDPFPRRRCCAASHPTRPTQMEASQQQMSRPPHRLYEITMPPAKKLRPTISQDSMVAFKPTCIMVTGGAGFIASHIVIQLVKKFPQYKVGTPVEHIIRTYHTTLLLTLSDVSEPMFSSLFLECVKSTSVEVTPVSGRVLRQGRLLQQH